MPSFCDEVDHNSDQCLTQPNLVKSVAMKVLESSTSLVPDLRMEGSKSVIEWVLRFAYFEDEIS